MHLKRNSIPKTWPLVKKGTTYVIRVLDLEKTMPLIIIIRDILKLAKTRKEVKAILVSSQVKINDKIVKEEKYPVRLFDTLSIGDKSFKVVLKNKKFSFESGTQAKISKIIGKRIFNKKFQLNLNDGSNILTSEKSSVGDSVAIKGKSLEILPLKEKSQVLFIKGKHLGEQGVIEKIEGNQVLIKLKDEKINSSKENIMVVK